LETPAFDIDLKAILRHVCCSHCVALFFDISLVEIHYDVNDKQRCGRKPSWLLIEFYRTDRRITWKSVIRTLAALRCLSFLAGFVPAYEAVSSNCASL